MTSVDKIMKIAKSIKKSHFWPLCEILDPPVKLWHEPRKGIVTATMVDISGKHPNHVYTEEMRCWSPADQFKIPD